MKRLLQAVSVVLALIAVGLVWRIVQVSSISLPQFGDPPQVSDGDPLPPPPRTNVPSGAVEEIVAGNLFETDRGSSEESAEGEPSEEPLPPPTNVVLNGVFFQTTGRPMAIMTDTSSGNRQLTLQPGDNVGDYQVGDITRDQVTLLGRGGQQFSLMLDIGKGTGGSAAPAARPATPPRPQPAAVRTPPQASQAQTPAQRAAAQRAAQARRQQAARARAAGAQQQDAEQPQNDAMQARLEALKRLREAASRR